MDLNKYILIFLLIICAAFSFNPYNYTYDNENVSITSLNFSLNNASYILYYFNDTPTFLYKIGDSLPITNETVIKNVLFNYYKNNYYIDNEDLINLTNIVLAFNKSRNDGAVLLGHYYQQEEIACRKALGENLPPPSNPELYHNDTYYYYSVYICSNYGDELGCNKVEDIYDDIKSFFESSYGLDKDVDDMLNIINNINATNVYSSLSNLSTLMHDAEQNVETIKSNKFRYPAGGVEECSDCYGVCVELEVNETAINKFYEIINKLKNKTKLLGEYNEIALTIYNNTNQRLEYAKNRGLRLYYTSQLNEALERWSINKNETDKNLELLENETLNKLRLRIDELINEINNSINNNNFTNLDEKLKNLDNLINSLPKKSVANKDLYISIVGEANKVENLFILAEAYGIDTSKFKQEKNYLDLNFIPGIDVDKAIEFKKRYEKLANDLVNEIQKHKTKKTILELAGSLTRGATNALYAFISDYPYEERIKIVHTFPIILSLLSALSLSSLASWLIIIIYARLRYKLKYKHKIMMLILFAVSALIFVIFGASTYFLYNNFINKGNIGDFFTTLHKFKSIYIIVNATEQSNAMMQCAALTKDAASNYGRQAYLITLYDNKCMFKGKYENKETCLNMIKRPYMILSLSKDSILYKSVNAGEIFLNIEATDAYYKRCPIPSFFEVAK